MATMIDQRGSTLMLSLFCLAVIGLLLAGAMTFATDQLRITRLDEDRVRAEYIAEAGAKVGLNMTFRDNRYSGSLNDQPVRDGSTDSYDLTWKQENLNRVVITSTGRTGNTTRTIRVNVDFKPGKPGLLDLFDPKTASFSCDGANTNDPSDPKKWTVTGEGENKVGNPPDAGFNQILFNDHLDEVSGFKLEYYATLTKITNESATGFGIYYFATGTADNLTSYVLQYDPGAEVANDGGAFFVKKVMQSDKMPSNPSNNETREFYKGFEDNVGGNMVRMSFVDIAKKIKGFQVLNQKHKITIDYKNGHHVISIDDVPILDFYDKDWAHEIPKHNAGTGLRVWNARVNFYNAPGTGQGAPAAVTWVRQ